MSLHTCIPAGIGVLAGIFATAGAGRIRPGAAAFLVRPRTPTARPGPSAAQRRAAQMKADIGDFRLCLEHLGERAEARYRLTLHVRPDPAGAAAPAKGADLRRKIDQRVAAKLIDHLAAEGFLARAKPAAERKGPAPNRPCCVVHAGDLREDLGWNAATLRRLGALRGVLAAAEGPNPKTAGWKALPGGGWRCNACPEPPVRGGTVAPGTCKACGAKTPTRSWRLCRTCSAKLGRCVFCGAAPAGKATTAMDEWLDRLAAGRRAWRARAAPRVAGWIRQLGAKDWQERETATQNLINAGEDLARAPLEAKAREPGNDPEVATRIERILAKFNVKEGRSVTDRATGMTFSLSDDGSTITAARNGKIVWRARISGKAASLRLEGGKLVAQPGRFVFDTKTGRLLERGGPIYHTRATFTNL